jgi:hypothetical protein
VVECTGLENQQSRKVLVGSNPTASARARLLRALAVFVVTALGACTYFTDIPGETLAKSSQQRAISQRMLDLAQSSRPGCRDRKITDSEIVDLHPDGMVALERWTVTQCGERIRYIVSFPPTGRGAGFTVQPDK